MKTRSSKVSDGGKEEKEKEKKKGATAQAENPAYFALSAPFLCCLSRLS